ncbi:MAG: T9SS type A sorting domain-containing protein [Bacteroidetes bacterium]|nr:T9SS type A sorting domain-containing protein [Bacteroidota bacterium]
MKHLRATLFLLFTAFGANLSLAQSFSDNFDGYNIGQGVVAQNSKWTYWRDRGPNLTPQDANVDNKQAISGKNALYFESNDFFGGPTNVVLPFGQTYDIGSLHYEMMLFVDANSSARMNFQGEANLGNTYTLEFEVSTNGNFILFEDGETFATGTFAQGEWVKFEIDADLTLNKWKFKMNGKEVASFKSLSNQLFAANFFPQRNDAFWIDDVYYKYTKYDYPDVNAAIINAKVSGGGIVGASATVSVNVKNLGVDEINELSLTYIYNNQATNQEFKSLSLFTGVDYNLNFDLPFTLAHGQKYIEVKIDGVNSEIGDDRESDNTVVVKLEFISPTPGKIILGEEMTSTECGLCPAGMVSRDSMSKAFKDNYYQVSIHTNDPMASAETYFESLEKLTQKSEPATIINRSTVTESTPDEVYNAIMKELETPIMGKFTIGAQTYLGVLHVSAELDSLGKIGEDWQVVCLLVEDSVIGNNDSFSQLNGYFRGFAGDMGGWENLDREVSYKDITYKNIVRDIKPRFSGDHISRVKSSNKKSLQTFSFPLNGYDYKKLTLAVALIDADGKINNVSLSSCEDAIEYGYEGPISVSSPKINSLTIYPNPTNGTVTIANPNLAKGNLNVYNAQGKLVNEMPVGKHNSSVTLQFSESGLYLIQLNQNNKVYSQTVVVR